NIIPADNTLAIRVVKDEFCEKLLRKFRRPIVSTSANVTGEPTPLSFSEISDTIKDGVDYIVNLNQKNKAGKSSAIIKLTLDGQVSVIRK
ncbi:MAG: L-threonylcarbamoyladenylate synthase, partial [Patiriisocius sp.]